MVNVLTCEYIVPQVYVVVKIKITSLCGFVCVHKKEVKFLDTITIIINELKLQHKTQKDIIKGIPLKDALFVILYFLVCREQVFESTVQAQKYCVPNLQLFFLEFLIVPTLLFGLDLHFFVRF